jgi:hypothetical protein
MSKAGRSVYKRLHGIGLLDDVLGIIELAAGVLTSRAPASIYASSGAD